MKPVFLTPLKKLKQLREKSIHVFDTETTTKGFFKLVSYAKLQKSKKNNEDFKTEVFTFYDFNKFVDFLFIKKVDIIYCYNLKFDSRFIPDYILYQKEKGNQISHVKIQSSSQFLGVKIKRVIDEKEIIVTFKDFLPFCLTSLDKISKTFGCKYKKFPDFEQVAENNDFELTDYIRGKLWDSFFEYCSLQSLKIHCENDVKILAELIYLYRKMIYEQFSIDVLDKKIYSLASLTMKIFRTNFITEPIWNSFINVAYNVNSKKYEYDIESHFEKFVRKSYKGGYCANFSNKKEYDIVSYDINSSYPYQATLINFPVGRAYHTIDFTLFKEMSINIPGFCELEVDFNHEIYFLPVLRNDNKLGRVKGYWKGVLTSYEMEWLETKGIPFNFVQGYYFTQFDETYCLKNFCETLYKMRLEQKRIDENNPLVLIYKIVLNSLTGKFGQKMNVEQKINTKFFSAKEYEDLEENNYEFLKINNKYLYGYTKIEKQSIKPFQMVSWISLITAKGRIQLMDMVFKTNAVYCDTDSVYCKRDKVVYIDTDETKLGSWKLEHRIKEFRALAPKFYAYFDLDEYKKGKPCLKIRCKGVPFKYYKKRHYEEIMNFIDGNEIIFNGIYNYVSFNQSMRLKNVDEQQGMVKFLKQNKILKPKQKI